MKQKYVYKIHEASNGWLSVERDEVNTKDKSGFYLVSYHLNLGPCDGDGGPDYTIEASYLFENENKTWWRNPQDAKAALNLRLRKMYLEGKPTLKNNYSYNDYDGYYDNEDRYDGFW